MKILCILLTAASLQLAARGYSQGITLSLKNAPLEKLFKQIEQQTNYTFVYSQEAIAQSRPVTVEVKNETLDNVLRLSFANQSLGYTLDGKFIIIKVVDKKKETPIQVSDLNGRVINEKGEPLAGASVSVKNSKIGTATDKDGNFHLSSIDLSATLIVTSVGYKPEEIEIAGRSFLLIQLYINESVLDETVIIGYGKTTQLLNTSNISRISSADISKQPVTNLLAAIEGRIPGLLVTQSNGLPGSSFKVQIQGARSIAAYGLNPIVKNDPLFVVDGVPLAGGNDYLSLFRSALGYPQGDPSATTTGGLSPFSLINPADIESIEILKDADATAIYGSRGANGVILITTKKAASEKTKFTFSIQSGISEITRTQGLLNTKDYLEMRREAIMNEGSVPNTSVFTAGYAPDLLLWDTTKYTDWKKYFIGGTAHNTDAHFFISGGSINTQFILGAGYTRQTTVFPGNLSDNRGTMHFNLNHNSGDKRFTINFNTDCAIDDNNLISQDLTDFITIAPNFPNLLDQNGKLKWADNGVDFRTIGFSNPMAFLQQPYKTESINLLSSTFLSYKVTNGLILRANLGYNATETNENLQLPLSSQNPANGGTASSKFGHHMIKGWSVEPQIEYTTKISKGSLEILGGLTWQMTVNSSSETIGSAYATDDLLGSINAAGNVQASDDYSQYKYNAAFGRLNYNWQNKYIVNVTGRRDGSSRFGPGRQFANFGAVGTSWIISNEKFFAGVSPALSFAKIKCSYGSTGNDQIGNYIFLNAWDNNGLLPYQGVPVLSPVRLFNSDFGWETNKKLSVGFELGLLKNRIMLTSVYYRNRSGNQLVVYNLPTQTGFAYLQAYNLPAKVQNTGWEFSLSSKNFSSKEFTWVTSFNLTINRNKLLAFPDLDKSPYSTTYIVGQPLSVINKIKYKGVDPSTGVYSFVDLNNDGQFDENDYQVEGNLDPKFFGGMNNSFTYKGVTLDVFLEFRKQTGTNYLADQSTHVPGFFYYNQPTIVLDRWNKPGDQANIQKYTSSYGSAYNAASNLLLQSDGIYSDASFIRVKNVSLSYSFPEKLNSKLHLSGCRFFILAQNLFTITNYEGADPETQSIRVLPPLRTISGGIQLTF